MELAAVAVEIVVVPVTITDAVIAPQSPVVHAATGREITACTSRCPSVLDTEEFQPLVVSGFSQHYTRHGQRRLPQTLI
jgi:hypothetical protein